MRSGYWSCRPLDLPPSPPSSLRPDLHGCIIKAFSIPRGKCDIVQSVAQCPIAYNSNIFPRPAGLCYDPESNSSLYVHSTDVALTSLMVVTQFVVHARCISALQLFPSSSPSSPCPHLHGRTIKTFSIPRGESDIIQSVAQCTTRISFPGLDWTA